jgi:hypothetical protein
MPWREGAAGMCAGYTFLKRIKKLPKYAKILWTRRLFNDGVQEGNNLLRKLNTEGSFNIQEFRQDDEK